jgi:hypothetical protein
VERGKKEGLLIILTRVGGKIFWSNRGAFGMCCQLLSVLAHLDVRRGQEIDLPLQIRFSDARAGLSELILEPPLFVVVSQIVDASALRNWEGVV